MQELGQSWDVFISYAKEDVEPARWLRDQLVASGRSAFLAADDLYAVVGSAQWSERIDQILDSASVLVLLTSPAALESEWVKYEWRSFHDAILAGRSGILIPVCLGGPAPEKLPRALRRYQCVDFRSEAERDASYEEIAALIVGYFAEVERNSAMPPASVVAPASEAGDDQADHARPTTLTPREVLRERRQKARLVKRSATALTCVGLGVGVWWYAQHAPSIEPRRATTPASKPQPVAQPALRTPALGLRALQMYANLEDASAGELASPDAWAEAEHDFGEAAAQPGAPIRWKAARHFAEAQRALRLGEEAAAEAGIRRSLELEPGWALPYVALSGILSGKDTKAAVEAAMQARSREPDLWIAIAALGSAYVYGDELERGLEQYRRVLLLAPHSNTVKATLALALHSAGGKYDLEAARLAREAIAASDGMVAAHLVLAEQALELRDFWTALEHAQRAATLAPRDIRAQLVLGDSHQLLGHKADALAAFKTTVALATKASVQGVARDRLAVVTAALKAGKVPRPRRVRSSDKAERSRPRPTPDRSKPRQDVASELQDPWD